MFTVIQKHIFGHMPPRWVLNHFCEENGIEVRSDTPCNGVLLEPEDFDYLSELIAIRDRSVLNESELQTLYDKLTAISDKKREELLRQPGDEHLFDEVVNLQLLLTSDLWNAISPR